jgi:hypothetical protein
MSSTSKYELATTLSAKEHDGLSHLSALLARSDQVIDSGQLRRLLWTMSLLTDLDAVPTEHRRWADLDGGVDGGIVWMACDCRACMARRVNEDVK